MKSLIEKVILASRHLIILDKVFRNAKNYSRAEDYLLYNENVQRFEELVNSKDFKEVQVKIKKFDLRKTYVNTSFSDEIYHQYDRQMKLSDLIEYLFFSRGIYFLFQTDQFRKDRVKYYIEIILRFVNLLMVFESLTVDNKLRKHLLNKLKTIIDKEIGYKELKKWNKYIGHPKQNINAPSEYFDTLLPKTAGGLWHEMLVFAFILKYDIGYIFPLLLNQKPISLDGKLSPPDLIILHKQTFRYYGIEIGNLKERQSGGFMSPSGIPIIPIDTLNARI